MGTEVCPARSSKGSRSGQGSDGAGPAESGWQYATVAISDAVIAQAQRWAKIQDLHGRIDKVEAEALYQDDLVEQLTHIGNGKTGAVVKAMNAMGSVGAVKFRLEAESIAPKLPACVISSRKSKRKTNPASASLLP
jgi:hypothetical protein